MNPIKSNLVVKTERDVEKQLGIIKTENSNESHNASRDYVGVTAGSAQSWAEEKQMLIDKIVSLKSENQHITQNFNEKHTELSTLKKSKELLEERMKDKEKEFSLKVGALQLELSKSLEKVESNQKSITNFKRENQLLMSQTKQLKSSLAEGRAEMEEAHEDDMFEVENILDDKLVTSTERSYLIRWNGFDSSHDSWERESNLSCPSILKKYKISKNKTN